MEEKFNIFVPIDIIEKGKRGEDGLPEELHIAGVASMTPSDQSKRDLDGEWLDVNGFDYKPFLQKGFFNLEHKGREDYANIIGEPISAAVKDGKFYVEGKLYKENPKAVSVWQLGQILKKAGSTRKIGFSIEGKAKERDPLDPKKVTKATVTGVAVTISPKNDGTECLFKGEVDYEKQPGSELLIDITDDNGTRWTVDKDLNIEKGGPGSGRKSKGFKWSSMGQHHSGKQYVVGTDPKTGKTAFGVWNKNKDQYVLHHDLDSHPELKKAMIAGDTTGTETTDKNLTQQPLKQESVEGKRKKKLKDLMKRKGEKLTKAETLTLLVNDFDLDNESVLNVWGLIERIEKKK